MSREAASLLTTGRYTCVLWSSIPRDWSDPDGWVETALAHIAGQPWTLMVLHDVPSGAMRHLDRFLTEAKRRGARLRQDFPPACVPITRGQVTGPLADFVTG